MLENLHSRYPLSIISVRGQKSTDKFLYQFELLPIVHAVATSQTCIHTKPYPTLLWAAEKLGVPASPASWLGIQ